ncbi:hypothetical protein MKK84_11280 [Methylobacterium sp. E-065]|uniref:hypothetical protein n=1 Tax=Methylobacterium sp. E-065 TaxID=2836583 RepID=UPI001FB926DD|nr:hypothetical protein [Methylobacterium sp. E-065]MCJ2018001.1 hypothetical protein [Methylobacterium sp. E-065]
MYSNAKIVTIGVIAAAQAVHINLGLLKRSEALASREGPGSCSEASVLGGST